MNTVYSGINMSMPNMVKLKQALICSGENTSNLPHNIVSVYKKHLEKLYTQTAALSTITIHGDINSRRKKNSDIIARDIPKMA
jgi:hypothetical protein